MIARDHCLQQGLTRDRSSADHCNTRGRYRTVAPNRDSFSSRSSPVSFPRQPPLPERLGVSRVDEAPSVQ
jgi:hypothetical protein